MKILTGDAKELMCDTSVKDLGTPVPILQHLYAQRPTSHDPNPPRRRIFARRKGKLVEITNERHQPVFFGAINVKRWWNERGGINK